MSVGTAAVEALLGRSGAALLLAACRCGPLLLMVPMLGRVGRGVALVLGTLLVTPLLWPAVHAAGLDALPLSAASSSTLWLCLRELFIGGTLALAATLPWAVLRSVGALVDGAADQAVARAPRSHLAAELYGALAVALFLALGGARTTLTALAASYELLPLLRSGAPEPSAPSLMAAASALVVLSGKLLTLAIRLALPLLAAQLLAELLLGLLARSFGTREPEPAQWTGAVRSLLWLAVLLLGAQALAPALGQLLALWPQLWRSALPHL